MGAYLDGLKSFVSDLINRRNALQSNGFVNSTRVSNEELAAIHKTGIGNKIVRIKVGHALDDTIQFASDRDKEIYQARIEAQVKEAAKWMMVFGRGIIVLFDPGEKNLDKKRTKVYDPMTVSMRVFSGDDVSVQTVTTDLLDDRYYKPEFYTIRGQRFHHSRVIDFTYIKPTERDAPMYDYGGISEFELIRAQLVNDAIIERCVPTILEKNSVLFYSVKGFKEALQAKQDGPMRDYFSQLENARSIYGAGLLDVDDAVTSINQTLTNLADADQISLRRISMVTGIPLPYLVGENVKGLNASGENESRIFQNMIEAFEGDYIYGPINELMLAVGLGRIEFKENQGRTADERIIYESKAIDNALKLNQIGEDYGKYLEEKGVTSDDAFDEMFRG